MPIDKINWNSKFLHYKPTNFTSEKIKNRSGGGYKDPDVYVILMPFFRAFT